MRKETISRKRVKDRIHEWVKTHPDGQFYAQWATFEFKPFLDGKEIKIPEDLTLEQIEQFIDTFIGDWILQFEDRIQIDDEIESHVMDKSKSLPKKTKVKQKKLWVLEYKWKSQHAFNTKPRDWFTRNEEYSEDWKKTSFTDTFKKPEDAENSIKSKLRSRFLASYVEGREWRVKHKETGEIHEFINIENYYK